MHLTVVLLELISVLVYIFAKTGANMLIDIGPHAGTDVVLFTKLCDLIKRSRKGQKVTRCC